MSSLWLFAYGSLLWHPGFRWSTRVRGYVPGRVRRFWQGSIDHRGTPEAPGRVATLHALADGECWGAAYEVEAQDADAVLAELDRREQAGYERARLPFVAKDREHRGEWEVMTYVAPPENPNYLGDAPLTALARQIRESQGPSGHNVEYVLRLAEALDELGVVDTHVFELANLVSDPDAAEMQA